MIGFQSAPTVTASHLSRLGNGEKNLFRFSGTKATRPSERARASQCHRLRPCLFTWKSVLRILPSSIRYPQFSPFVTAFFTPYLNLFKPMCTYLRPLPPLVFFGDRLSAPKAHLTSRWPSARTGQRLSSSVKPRQADWRKKLFL